MFYCHCRNNGFWRLQARHCHAADDTQENRNHAEEQVTDSADVKRILSDTLVFRRGNSLEQGLRGDIDNADDCPCTQVIEPLLPGIFERQHAKCIFSEKRRDGAPTTNIDQYDGKQNNEAEHDDQHLHKVGQRDGPHAANSGVDEDDNRATDDALFHGHAGQRRENNAKCNQHRANPDDIGKQRSYDNADRCDLTEALLHEVHDCQHAKPPEHPGKEEPDE